MSWCGKDSGKGIKLIIIAFLNKDMSQSAFVQCCDVSSEYLQVLFWGRHLFEHLWNMCPCMSDASIHIPLWLKLIVFFPPPPARTQSRQTAVFQNLRPNINKQIYNNLMDHNPKAHMKLGASVFTHFGDPKYRTWSWERWIDICLGQVQVFSWESDHVWLGPSKAMYTVSHSSWLRRSNLGGHTQVVQ